MAPTYAVPGLLKILPALQKYPSGFLSYSPFLAGNEIPFSKCGTSA